MADPPGKRWRLRGEQVAIQAVGNALGTFVAGLVLLLGGVLLGVFQDIDLDVVATAVTLFVLVLSIAALVASFRQRPLDERPITDVSAAELRDYLAASAESLSAAGKAAQAARVSEYEARVLKLLEELVREQRSPDKPDKPDQSEPP